MMEKVWSERGERSVWVGRGWQNEKEDNETEEEGSWVMANSDLVDDSDDEYDKKHRREKD